MKAMMTEAQRDGSDPQHAALLWLEILMHDIKRLCDSMRVLSWHPDRAGREAWKRWAREEISGAEAAMDNLERNIERLRRTA